MMMTADCAPHQAGHNGLTSVLDYLYDLLCSKLEPNHSYDDRSNLFNLELELVRLIASECIWPYLAASGRIWPHLMVQSRVRVGAACGHCVAALLEVIASDCIGWPPSSGAACGHCGAARHAGVVLRPSAAQDEHL